jgi:hypothetical protein
MINKTAPVGLASLSDEHLKAALRLLTQGKLRCPFKRSDLMAMGLNPLAEQGDLLFGLDERGVRAALIASLGERREAESREHRLKTLIEQLYNQLDQLRSEGGGS